MNRDDLKVWIFLLCWLMVGIGHSQPINGLPALEVSYSNDFSQADIPYANKCFKQVLSDQTGQLWLVPCGVEQLVNGANLFQFDGYQVRYVPIRLANGSALDASVFREVGSKGQMYGWTRQGEFLSLDINTWQARFIPLADTSLGALKIRNTIATEETIYLTALSQQDSILLLSIDQDSLYLQQSFDYSDGVWHIAPYPLLIDDQEIWLSGASIPIFNLDRKTGRVRTFRQKDFLPELPPLNQKNVSRVGVHASILKQKDAVFVYLPGYEDHLLFRLDREKDQFVSLKEDFPANWKPQQIFQDEVGNICFLFKNEQGVYQSILRTIDGKHLNYSAITQQQSDLNEMQSHDFRQEVLMIGKGGLFTVGVRQPGAIKTILNGKPANSMAALPDGRLLINVQDGIGWYTYDPKTAETAPFVGPDCGSTRPAFGPGMKQQIIPDKTGKLWFLLGEFLVNYDPSTQACQSFNLGKKANLFNFVNEDLVLVNSDQYLFFYNIRTQKQEATSVSLELLKDRFVKDIFIDSQGLIWLPTNQGLWQINLKEGSLKRIDQENEFADSRFTSIYEDQRGRFWIGTYFAGLYLYEPEVGITQVFNQQQGLSSNAIMSILPDQADDIWVGTERGISLISKEGVILGSFHQEDGLNAEKFERFDPFRTDNGLLYFNNRKGINRLDPALLKSALAKRATPKLFLTELAYFDPDAGKEVVQLKSFAQLKPIKIPAKEPYIRLKFGISSYLTPELNRYAYKIDQPGEDWHYLGSQPELFINRLQPGKYRLLIKGADFQNRWTVPVAIPIHAKEIFYKRAWFYLLLALPFVVFTAIWMNNKKREAQRLEQEVAERTHKIQKDKILIEQQADELKKTDELKNKFFVQISHELRTPLTLIATGLEHLLGRRKKELKEGAQKDLQRILRSAETLEERVEEFLELSQLGAQKAQLQAEHTLLSNFIKDLFDAFQHLAEQNQINYEFKSDLEANAWYPVDRKRLSKVLNNLLYNAFKFTKSGGKIGLFVQQKTAALIIEIKDTGEGISKDDLPYIFDPYFQTKGQNQLQNEGVGIGLALVKEQVRLMNGQLHVDSQVGEGTQFQIRLPLVPKDLLTKTEQTAPTVSGGAIKYQANGTPLKPKVTGKVLIVEDDPDLQILLENILSDSFTCVVASNGEEAWQWLSKEKPLIQNVELILTDLMMPVMDGLSLLNKVKADPRWQSLPVVVLTAVSQKEYKLKSLRMGVDDYIRKPFSSEELLVRIENLLSNHQFRKQAIKEGPEDTSLDSVDYQWLKTVENAAQEALVKRTKLTSSYLAAQALVSERHFLRKLKLLTGLSPNAYIQEIKLQKARSLLENKTYSTVAEVANACGYSSASYLAKIYKERFGKRPGDYA